MVISARHAGVAQLVERHVANVVVAGPSPVTRFFSLVRQRSQVVRQWSAKPLFPGSNPGVALVPARVAE